MMGRSILTYLQNLTFFRKLLLSVNFSTDLFSLAPCEMIKNDANNNNKEELNPIKEECENELTEINQNLKSDTFDLFSLKTLLPPQIPPKGSYFDLTVTFAVSPDSFVIQPHNQGNTLAGLLADMAAFYSDPGEATNNCEELDISKEKYYAGPLAGGEWHRVQVSNYIPCGDSSQAIVRYVDQGSSAMLPVSELRPLHAQFRNHPCQAVSARLAGVLPAAGQADWAPEDNYWFNHRVAGKMFVGRVVENTDNNVMVELVDTSHPTEDHYIHKQLIMVSRWYLVTLYLYCQDGRAVARQ